MEPRKRGIITMEESIDSRKQAIKAGNKAKKSFCTRIPYRVDRNTIIMLRTDQDLDSQITRFLKTLENNRKNY